jgi:hypothetical protein
MTGGVPGFELALAPKLKPVEGAAAPVGEETCRGEGEDDWGAPKVKAGLAGMLIADADDGAPNAGNALVVLEGGEDASMALLLFALDEVPPNEKPDLSADCDRAAAPKEKVGLSVVCV